MKFTYVCLIIIFFAILGCHNVTNNGPAIVPDANKQNPARLDAPVVDMNAKPCTNNTWSRTGREPCTACPTDSKADEKNVYCVCNDNTLTFSFYENKCKKKLSPAVRDAFLLM